jgi:hypothetical protein
LDVSESAGHRRVQHLVYQALLSSATYPSKQFGHVESHHNGD